MGARLPRLILSGALVAGAGTALPEDWKDVEGGSLQSLFAGRELGDGAHYAYRFRADGTFSGTELGRDVEGAWRVRAGEICLKWIRPPEVEQCYGVQKDGPAVRLLIYGSEARFGTLRP